MLCECEWGEREREREREGGEKKDILRLRERDGITCE